MRKLRIKFPSTATGLTLSGPTSGVSAALSTPFTVTFSPVGTSLTGTTTVTPNDNGGGGSFTPTSVALTSATPSGTFRYTPQTVGAKVIRLTNDRGLTNPANWAYTSIAPVVADFSASPVSGGVPLTVTYTNLSSGATSYAWTFEGGTPATSTSTSPTVTYSTAGLYDTTLVATGVGGTSTKTQSDYISVTSPGIFAWQFADLATLNTGRNSTLALAVNVPAGATYYASPDLLPGQSLSLSGTTLNLVGDSTVPTVSSSDSVLDLVSAKDVVITVLDSPVATIRNASTGTTYPHAANRWWSVMQAASAGQTIEISPGSVFSSEADAYDYYVNLKGTLLNIWKSVTVKGYDGQGRWRILPQGATYTAATGGIGLMGPLEVGSRLTITVRDFDIVDQYGYYSGVKLYGGNKTVGTYNDMLASVTVSNFKVGRTSGNVSPAGQSGFSGSAEVFTITDGHLFDHAGNESGQEHEAYISARSMTLRGLRVVRSRALNGQMLKLSAVNGTIEGCCIEAYSPGDPSHNIQLKAGGNWTIRGCLIRDSADNTQAGRGPITMLREYAADNVTPNYEWWAGSEGNSLDIQRCVFVSHYGRPLVWFFPQGVLWAMKPSNSGDAWALQPLVIKDNIGMVPTTPTVLSPFSSAKWIYQDPNAGAAWSANNSEMTYGSDEPGFSTDDKLLKLYRRSAGTIAASGSLSTYRFVWPHGSEARTDSVRGLG